jgi:phage tail P2-like protein
VANNASLLPPNATALETALATAFARISLVPVPLAPLNDPITIPLPLLPWLAWGLSTDMWRAGWDETRRRNATAQAIPNARKKGSRDATDAVMAEYDPHLTVKIWHESGGTGIPYTYTVTLPLDGAGGDRATAAFARDLYSDLAEVKGARDHFTLRQYVAARTVLPIAGAARTMRAERFRATPAPLDPNADLYLQTEYGEPIEGGEGLILEDH